MATAKKRVHPDALGRLIRAMDKHSVEAVEKLYKLTQSQNEDIAYKASKDYLKILAELKQQLDDRDLKKLLAQAKLMGGRIGTQDDEDVATVDFETLQQIS